jgi:acyl-CoA synthetase (NDP forming)
MPHPLDPIFNPRVIAVIGASNDPEKRGYRAIKTLFADRYQGKIVPINPKSSEILGLKCYAKIEDVPDEVDLALVCTAAKTVPEVVRSCGMKGVKGALLLAGGFSEASEEGAVIERKAVAIAREHGIRLIGPNTNGMFSARFGCNAIGWFDLPRGPLAMIANSANVMLSIVTEAQMHRHFGFSTLLPLGNQADIQFHECLEALSQDADTKAVISYIEGFKNGRAFYDVARRVSPQKLIVMFKAGRTAAGVSAAKSHSGSLAGDYAVATGVIKQAGIVMVERSDCLFPVAEALSLLPPMPTRRVAILSEGGGVITVAAEALAERGMVLARLDDETQRKLKAIVPAASALSNPVDAGGGTDPRAEYYGLCGRAILEDPNVDALLCVGFLGGYARRYGEAVAATENAVCTEFGELMRQHGKAIVVQSHYAHFRTAALDVLRNAGVPFYRSIEIAAQCLASLADYSAMRRRLAPGVHGVADPGFAVPQVQRLLAGARAANRVALLETESRAVLVACGIAMPPTLLLKQADDANAAVQALGAGALALKVVSQDVLHKSEAGGVILNVAGADAIRLGFAQVMQAVQARVPGAAIDGVLAATMAPKGVELIVGVTRDPQFGPVILFGLGGVFVETIKDVVFRAVPIARADAEEMIADIHFTGMLEGARGMPKVNKDAIVELLLKISALAAAHPDIAEIDLNPVIAHGDTYSVVDARMILSANAAPD